MKASKKFVTQKTEDGAIAVPFGKVRKKQRAMATFNDTAAFLWELLQTDQTAETLSAALVKEYGISEEQARADTEAFLKTLKSAGMLED